MLINCDLHLHTEYSFDSETPVRDMIEGSIRKGLKLICITDHYDRDYPIRGGVITQNAIDCKKYYNHISGLREEYKDKIDVRIGIEIGFQPWLGEFYHQLVNEVPFDMVIGSMHVISGGEPYFREIFGGRTDEDVYYDNFVETLENIQKCWDFDVLGHIDYIVRYGDEQDKYYSYERYAPEIDKLLKRLIELGKGIELNTAGFKYGLPFPHPHPDIIKRYKELGGEIITIGSDAHIPSHIAYDYHKVGEILDYAGFKYYTEFKDRKPSFVKLCTK